MRTRSIWTVVLLFLALVPPAAAAQTQPGFSSYTAVAFRSDQTFPKWQLVREGVGREAEAVRHCLEGAECATPQAAEIAGRMRRLEGAEPLAQAEAVHRLMNARPYEEDRRQFGRSDVWQTPFAFWRQGGDCEDYAIAKYMALRALGFDEERLLLTVLVGRARGEVHAVLLIEIAGDWYVADNLKRGLRPLDRYDGWKPVFSVSDAGAWRYVARSLADGADLAAAAPAGDPEPATRTVAEAAPNRARF